MKKCPFCAEEIQDEAILCKHCHSSLPAQARAPHGETPAPAPRKRASRILLAVYAGVGILGLVLIVAIIAMQPAPTRPATQQAKANPVPPSRLRLVIDRNTRGVRLLNDTTENWSKCAVEFGEPRRYRAEFGDLPAQATRTIEYASFTLPTGKHPPAAGAYEIAMEGITVRCTDAKGEVVTDERKTDPVAAAAQAADARNESLIEQSKQAGLIQRLDEGLNYVYVNPLLWASLNIDEKRGFAIACARHFKARGNMGYAHIYDYMTGRRVAKMSSAGTFDVE